ncbi:MAG: rhodanese-like domain-containing protein [Phycisphaerae bacterium]
MKSRLFVPGLGLVVLFAGCANDASVRTSSSENAAIHRIKSAKELKARLDAHEVTAVHSLDRAHYQRGHIPGALHVDYERMEPGALPADKKAPLVFYCAGGGCPVSGMAARKAVEFGYTNVWVYEGGIKEWRAAGLKLATGSHP